MSERDVLQLLKMVRTAEHKLRPRGLFRAKAKSKTRGKNVATNGAAEPMPNGSAHVNGEVHADSRPPAPPAALPNSTLRARMRPQGAPQARMAPPPPPQIGHQDSGEPLDFSVPLPQGFASPDFPPPPPPPSHGEHAMPPPMHGMERVPFPGHAPNGFDDAQPNGFAGGLPSNGFDRPPPPPEIASPFPPMPAQFGAPPLANHGEQNGGHDYAPGPGQPMHADNGAESPFNAFSDPPKHSPLTPGIPGMPNIPPPSSAVEPANPLLAAMQQAIEMPVPAPPVTAEPPAFSQPPLRRTAAAPAPAPPPTAAPPPRPDAVHAAANGAGNGTAPTARRTAPDFSGLPPAMAESLAKLAGVSWPPSEGSEEKLEEHAAEAMPGAPRRNA
jgi:hypothetical protein